MNTYRILTGDAIEQIRTLPDASVHCVVTSPPYWGLRDYGVDGQIGLEQTPAEYVARLVDVFREVRRILRPDGVVFLNLGDSYNGSGGAGGDYGTGGLREGQPKNNGRNVNTLKPKDLVGIPWRVAFALQDDGWWLRSDIIWAKPNPMPESVTDRPTKAHEYIFLLTKRARYYFDADAVREANSRDWSGDHLIGAIDHLTGLNRNGTSQDGLQRAIPNPAGRNIRTVWDIATQPYSGAHFATMPTEIPRRCIRAGTSERGVCPTCGAPWVRVVERAAATSKKCPKTDGIYQAQGGTGEKRTGTIGMSGGGRIDGFSVTVGWQPSCACGGEPVPATVLDPFGGSGTTAAVAIEQGRDAVICELNPAYVELARRRIQDVAPLLSVEATV